MMRSRQLRIEEEKALATAYEGYDAFDRASFGYAVQHGYDEHVHVQTRQTYAERPRDARAPS